MPQEGKRLGAFPFVLGGVSFIPLIGVPFGVICVAWGLLSKKSGAKKLALVGALGVGFTILVYGSLSYMAFFQHGGMFDELRATIAQRDINTLVQSIEFYKAEHGSYPETLQQLRDSLGKSLAVMIYDRSREGETHNSPVPFFFYERVGDDHYYLRGIGPDGQPFTSDDLMPEVDPATLNRLGLLLERQENRL